MLKYFYPFSEEERKDKLESENLDDNNFTFKLITDANNSTYTLYEVKTNEATQRVTIEMNLKTAQEFACTPKLGFISRFLGRNPKIKNFDDIWDQVFPPNEFKILVPTQNIVAFKYARFFETPDISTYTKIKTEKYPLPSSIRDITRLSFSIDELTDEKIVSYENAVIGWILYVWREFDRVNDILYSDMNFKKAKEDLDKINNVDLGLKKDFLSVFYNYFIEKTLNYKEICSILNVRPSSLAALFFHKYRLNSSAVFRWFFETFNTDPDVLSKYALENIPYLMKYLDLEYTNDYIIDKTEVALFCYMYGVNRTGLYLVISFMKSMKFYMNDEMYINNTDYNKLETLRTFQTEAIYYQDYSSYVSDFGKKNIQFGTMPIKKTTINTELEKSNSISKNPLGAKHPVFKKPEITAKEFKVKNRELVNSESYIIDIFKEQERLMSDFNKFKTVLDKHKNQALMDNNILIDL